MNRGRPIGGKRRTTPPMGYKSWTEWYRALALASASLELNPDALAKLSPDEQRTHIDAAIVRAGLK